MNLVSRAYRVCVGRLLTFYGTTKSSMLFISSQYQTPQDRDFFAVREGSPEFSDHSQARNIVALEELTLSGSHIVLEDVLTAVTDAWKLFRTLATQMDDDQRLFILHTSYLWSPLIRFWHRVTRQRKGPRNWFAESDVRNLLELNGLEIIVKDSSLLLPIYLPGFDALFNRFLCKLPLIKHLNFIEFYIVKKRPNVKLLATNTLTSSVSLIVPTKDEKGNIEPLLRDMPSLGIRTEIIFVDGNSKDGTLEEIERLLPEYSNKFDIKVFDQKVLDGKGSAVWQGFGEASGDYQFVFDSDISVACKDLPKFVLALAEGRAGFVMGSRLVYPKEDQAMRFLNTLGNKVFSMIFSWLLNRPIKDTLCGTKGASRANIARIIDEKAYFGDQDPFADFDLIFGAVRANLKIIEIPIRYKNRIYGDIKISRFKHGWMLLKMTVLAARIMKFR